MKNSTPSEPFVVQGTLVDDTDGDAVLAARLQQEESTRADPIPAVSGRPYQQSYYQRYEYNDCDEERGRIVRPSNPLTDREVFVLEVWQLGRMMTCLAILDVCLLIFLSILDVYYLLLFWGPICGLVGASTYEVCYMYFYVLYYLLRIAGDTMMTLQGNLWSILALFCDVIIVTYIIVFVTYLTDINKSEKETLKNPATLLSRRRAFYYL